MWLRSSAFMVPAMAIAAGAASKRSAPSSSRSRTEACSRMLSSPFGPVTVRRSPSRANSTFSGSVTGRLAMRDTAHSTVQTISPPWPRRRASWSVITPRGVDTMAMPRPPCTQGRPRAGR